MLLCPLEQSYHRDGNQTALTIDVSNRLCLSVHVHIDFQTMF